MIELYIQVLNEYGNKNMLNRTRVSGYTRLLVNTESEHTQQVSQPARNRANIDQFKEKEAKVLYSCLLPGKGVII